MKLTKLDRVIMRYNLLLNFSRIPCNNHKEYWMTEMSQYLLKKLFKMEKKDMEKCMEKDFKILGKKEFEGETIYYLREVDP